MSGIESLTASLVREYLSRKGLKGTLQTLDEEMPRTEESISNRVQLAKEMHIERLMKKNKELPQPFRTMLEVMVKFMRELGGQTSKSAEAVDRHEVSPAKVKSSSRKEKKKTSHSDHDKGDHTALTSSEQHDYDILLRKMNEDSKNLKEKTKKDVKHETKEKGEQSQQKFHDERNDPQELPAKSNYVKDSGLKPQRNKLRTLGGPIVSSGLAGPRNGRTSRHTGGRVGKSLNLGKSNFFDDDVDLLGNTEVADRHKILESEQKTETAEAGGRSMFSVEDGNADFSPKPSRTTPQHKGGRSWAASSSKSHEKHSDELLFEDIDDDLDQEIGQLSLGPNRALSVDHESKPISLEIAMSLKNLIFGTATATFTPEWKQQSFSFCDIHNLEFGIVQLKGGPCGVLAAVQAIVLKHLLFADKRPATEPKRKLQPSPRERSRALVSALTEILWRAGNNKTATVTLPTGTSNFIGAGRYKPDHLTETLVLYTFDSKDGLQTFLSQHISQFESKSSSGCILLLYSVILSRSVKRVISDMDEPSNRLMGAHGYCAQEMVNLLTTGKAVSNVFDNVMELDSGGPGKCVLKGIAKQADVGLLSLFEHYESCQVGANLKSPKFPIWVVCSESHFSVLFSVDRNLLDDWKLGKKFDLYYYDGLARQDEEIKITVDTTKECAEYKDGDLLPPLELCIRTRWKRAVIDWNGSEPIL